MSAFLGGYRPPAEPFFTAIVTIEPHGSGTRYVATALHRDEDGGQRHEQMGLFDGCGEALVQLVEVAKTS